MNKYAYLIMVTEMNNNKYYEMEENTDGTFTARYGRVGKTCAIAHYDMSLWNKKYKEKIRKGYEDKTELHLLADGEQKDDLAQYKKIEEKTVADLISRLNGWAKKVVEKNYKISASLVTPQMIKTARIALQKVRDNTQSLRLFNNALLELFMTLPREMGEVSYYLAKEKDDIAEIISRETALLDIMEGQASIDKQEHKNDEIHKDETILDYLGLEIKPASENDINRIMRHLDSKTKAAFKQAWVVVNKKTQKAFDEFLRKNDNPKVGLLWHGSRNENWMSILGKGLVLNPNAVITGKMFGYGIYFALSASKSYGYTSCRGSYWAKGKSSSGFMALYATVKDRPYDVYCHSSRYYRFNQEKLKKEAPEALYLYAHKGKDLRNDEIIYYREDMMTIKYLVEFEN